MEKAFVNRFEKGLNGDIDKAVSPDGTFLSAENLQLGGDSKYLALENLAGTTAVETITAGFSGKVLGVFGNKLKVNDVSVDALTVFTALSGGNFKIWAIDVVNNDTYELYEETFTAEFEASNPVIDAVVYPENGTDIIYYADGYNEIRKIRLEVPSPYSANFLTSEQISLQRRATIAKLSLTDVNTGGSLLTGSYQFSLRLYNEDSKTYTRWTIPSSPVNVTRNPGTTELSVAGYGTIANKKIELQFDIPDEEVTNWTHYQFSVIKNVSAAPLLNADLLKLESLTGGSSSAGFTSFDFDYDSNIKIGEVLITDIVVDLAAIKSAKTIQTKSNRLFVANVESEELEYDNGDPTVSGSVLKRTVRNKDDFDTSAYRGYYRDEVYRFYITYFDDKYNLSRPKVLDMSSVTDNQISGAVDMKFKARTKAGYTVLNSSDDPTNLNLSLTINNHPSWARGFYIFRAKRKKKIKFQTPFIPSSLVEGLEVTGEYPNTYWTLDTDGAGIDENTNDSASPMNPVGTHIPKNLFFPVRRDYVRLAESDKPTQRGEVYIQAVGETSTSNGLFFAMPPNVYNSGTTEYNYTFGTGDSYNVVDYAFTRLDYRSFSNDPASTEDGNYLDTSVHGTFKALKQADYYYSWTIDRSTPSLPDNSGEVTDFKELDAYGEGTSISGLSVCDFNTLETTGIPFNPKPNNQRIGVFKLKTDKVDSALYGMSGYGGNRLTTSNGSAVSDTRYEVLEIAQSNDLTYEKDSVTSTDRVNIIDIVNIVNDLGDTRYGDVEDIHDMVFTGAQHVFNASQLSDVQTDGDSPITVAVGGGDCYVSLHQFKITDSHYGLVNVEKRGAGTASFTTSLLAERWEKLFKTKYHASYADAREMLGMPVPYRNLSQVISVYLESEINGEITDVNPYSSSFDNGQITVEETDNEYKLRIAFPYTYNIGLSKESNQKALIPFDSTDTPTTSFKARGYFSDVKVYGTGIDGFDIIRSSNIFDLEETYGGITKLALSADNMIALQESAVVYVPVDSSAVELADGSSLSVRSGTVGTPIYISRQYGCQHLRSVRIDDTSVFFPDNNNQAVFKLQGNQLSPIYEKGMIGNFNTLFTSDVSEQDMFGIWDNNKRQYWITTPTKCYVWDDRLEVWIGNREFGERIKGGNYINNKLYLVGVDSDLKVYTMYTGNYSSLMGTTVTPRVSISVNPDFEIPKTFDNVTAYSSSALATVDIVTEVDSGTNQSVSGMVFAVNREGNFRIATLRDSSSARLRGLRAIYTLNWPTTNNKVSLSQVLTKYRISNRAL